MRYLSVCSGIEAASCAWHPLGWTPVAFSEIEAFPSAVLAHHYPGVPNWGDMAKFQEWPDADVDVLVGGTPCQSFSVAGLRKGLADPRGNLALTYLAIADKYRPEWLVWENVPGVLSADKGEAFGAFLGGLGELGYGWAYRVLDAQYFGLAQRRKRVFVVASLGSWQRAAAVLFDSASLRGDSAPRREAREAVAPTIGGGPPFSRTGNERSEIDAYVPEIVAQAMSAKWSKGSSGPAGDEVANLVAHAFDARQSDVLQYGEKTGPLDTDGHSMAVAFAQNTRSEVRLQGGDGQIVGALASDPGMNQTTYVAFDWKNSAGAPNSEETFGTLCKEREMAVLSAMQVRRLTPRECERLQGFGDDYTLIPYRGKPAADGPRYKALGNSMAVPVMHWIGRRIQQVSDIQEVEATA